jgi:hypothetical protein
MHIASISGAQLVRCTGGKRGGKPACSPSAVQRRAFSWRSGRQKYTGFDQRCVRLILAARRAILPHLRGKTQRGHYHAHRQVTQHSGRQQHENRLAISRR